MAGHRDVAAFDARAHSYETGRYARLHCEIVHRTLALALAAEPQPRRVLDVGCGTGYLLRVAAERLPDAERFEGIDAAPTMVKVANAALERHRPGDDRLAVRQAAAERLPFEDGEFDIVVSTTSFDHWADQRAGLTECARVTRPGGTLVLVDQFSFLLAATLVGTRREKARTRRRATRLVLGAGYERPEWHHVYAAIINAVTARKPCSS